MIDELHRKVPDGALVVTTRCKLGVLIKGSQVLLEDGTYVRAVKCVWIQNPSPIEEAIRQEILAKLLESVPRRRWLRRCDLVPGRVYADGRGIWYVHVGLAELELTERDAAGRETYHMTNTGHVNLRLDAVHRFTGNRPTIHRFTVDDAELTDMGKRFRHDVTDELTNELPVPYDVPMEWRLVPSEYSTSDRGAVLEGTVRRVQHD